MKPQHIGQRLVSGRFLRALCSFFGAGMTSPLSAQTPACGQSSSNTKTAHRLLLTLLLALFTFHYSLFTASADLFSTNGFSKRAQIRVSGYTNSATLTNFPYLVSFTNGALNFNYGDLRTNGIDLRFCDNTFTNTLFHEIERWTSGGTSHVWVQIPRLNALTNSFWAFWGNATGTLPVSATNGATWSSNGYVGVWHMDLKGPGANFAEDVSTNVNNGWATNEIGDPFQPPTNTSGKVGNGVALQYGGRTNYINCGTNISAGTNNTARLGISGDTPFTIGAWLFRERTTTNTSGCDTILGFSSGPPNGGSIQLIAGLGNKIELHHFGFGTEFTNVFGVSVWRHVVVSYDPAALGGTTRLYVDGSLQELWFPPSDLNLQDNVSLFFGRMPIWYDQFYGARATYSSTQRIDEVRIASQTKSPTWIWAEYQNMASNSVFGTLDIYGAPIINNANGASNVQQSVATLVGNVLSTGGYLTAVTVYYGTTDGGTNAGAWANSYSYPYYPTVGLVTQQLTLNPNTPYYYRHYATNINGTRWAPSTASFTTLPSTNSSTHSIRIRLTTTVAGTQTNFPASVILNTSMTGFSYSDFASPVGNDLRFSTTNFNQEFSYEIERWNTNGDSYIWVLIPTMTSNTTILAHWGNTANAASPPAYTTNGAVWPNYRAVWHMNSSNLLDSTVYKRHATNYGGVITTGNIGGAMAFDTGKYAAWGGPSWTSSALTVEAIVNLDTIVSLQRLVTMNGYGVSLRNLKEPEGPNGSIEFSVGANRSVISDKALSRRRWHYVAGVVDSAGILRVYVDGTQVGIASGAPPPTIVGGFISDLTQDITRDGMVDEVRISDAALPLGRIRSTFINILSNATFTTVEDISREIMFEPFEHNSNSAISVTAGNLNGQNGWIATPFNGAIVQSTNIQAGTNAVTIGTNDVIVYRGFSDASATNVWVDFYAKPPRRTDPGHPGLSASAAVGFYVNTNFNIVARSGANWVTLTGAVATAYGGTTTNFAAASNNWTRFQVYLSYVPGKWWLLASPNVTGQQALVLATNLSFNAQRSSLSRFQVTATNALYSGHLDTVYVWKEDNVTNLSLPNLDLNTNNIPDAWERSYVIGGMGADTNADADGDGWNELAEYTMGTDPHSADSFTRITALELVNSTGNNVRVVLSGGEYNSTDGRNSSGDTRTYRIISSSTYTNLTKTLLGTQNESLSGENQYIDANAAINTSSRFYQVAVSMDGRTYTNTEQWAMFTQQRPPNGRQFMTVPVSVSSDINDQTLAGELGQQLGWGLHAGSAPETADYIAFRDPDSGGAPTWNTYYWISTNGGIDCYWFNGDPNTQPAVNDLFIQPGTPFWLYRRTNSVPSRTNAVMLGQVFRESDIPSVAFTIGNQKEVGWSLPDNLRQRNQGTNTSTNAMGFLHAAGGNVGNLSSPNSGSQLYIWNGNGWKSYWLYDNHSTNIGTLNRRWWDPSSNTYANINIEPGMAFVLYSTINWSPARTNVRPATNFSWSARMTN